MPILSDCVLFLHKLFFHADRFWGLNDFPTYYTSYIITNKRSKVFGYIVQFSRFFGACIIAPYNKRILNMKLMFARKLQYYLVIHVIIGNVAYNIYKSFWLYRILRKMYNVSTRCIRACSLLQFNFAVGSLSSVISWRCEFWIKIQTKSLC